MNDTMTTVVGNVVDSPRRVSLESGAVTNFRMASTARRYDSARQEFVDGETLWIDIECWNGLSANVSASISKGDPVIVIGALSTRSWETENGRRSAPRIKAFAVGPNLARGSAVFKRDRPARSEDGASGPLSPEAARSADDQFSDDAELIRGRDYEDAPETLHETNPADGFAEPANA